MAQKFILGLDIGSSSVRAALYDHSGKTLPKTLVKIEHSIKTADDGGAELDAEAAFRQIVAVVDEVLERSVNLKGEIAHVASCSFWHSLLGVDSKGKPTTKVLTWADTRGRNYVDKLRERFDESEVHDRTGARFHSSFWPAKLLWLKGRNPSGSEVAAYTAKWISFCDYVSLNLFGNAVTSVSMASGTGIFEVRKCEWDADLLRYLKLKSSLLPDVVSTDAITFSLSPVWKRRWPRLANAKWFPAIADGAANNIGSGCTNRWQAALMIGTSGAMRVAYVGEPPVKIPSGLFCYRIDRKRVVLGGALSDGGNLYDLLIKNLRIDLTDKRIGAEISRRDADAHGLTVMPFFNGERSTGYSQNAAGSILGLNASHDGIDILQAAMESVSFRFAEIFDQLKTVSRINQIVVSGGALEISPVWTQIIADVLGRDLLTLNQPEASMRGAVLLALESLGKIGSIDGFLNEQIRVSFHPKCHELYKKARKRHEEAYCHLMS